MNQQRLEAFLNRYITDVGAAMAATTILIGDELGLYKAIAEGGPVTAAQLASKLNLSERYVREWLAGQAAGGYIEYDPGSHQFYMTEEQAFALASPQSPIDVAGGFLVAEAMMKAKGKIASAFRTGDGVGWHEHHQVLFEGTERTFRPNYAAHLVSNWIPALHGVQEKLKNGAMVADVGCGLGASTIIMAEAYPNSRFYGFDYHPESVKTARERARTAGVQDRVTFEVASARDYPALGYDLIGFFDALHDMGDPVGAARHTRKALTTDGTWMIVEPFASDRVDGNLHPVGRLYYSASTMLCTPGSLAQDGRAALGAQAGEQRIGEVVRNGGFQHFRRAAETPLNIVFEARA
jgi:SAM-dependent methyltransferase